MKSRSHRLPIPSEPPDDWGDGSWTVDCSCGVTFDDGEEMVSCDECGVWVHTRCARFVRGEPSFACHKCKAARRRAHDASEETEVAQLLVELPTKAADPCPLPPGHLAPHRPNPRPWVHVPIEDRVHVQGVPGGDPGLFRGLSSVFSSELWRCAGYMPKKFNFQYREFPCWDEEEEEEGENPASRGADVLFSLSKETDPYVRPAMEMCPVPEGEKGSCRSRSQSSVKKERSKLRAPGSHSSKRRKVEVGEGKEWSGKKRSRWEPDRAAPDLKKKAGLIPVLDINKAGLCEEWAHKVAGSDIPVGISETQKDGMHSESNFIAGEGQMENGNKGKHIVVIKASRGGLSDEGPRKALLEAPGKVEKVEDTEHVIPYKVDALPSCQGEASDAAKEEVVAKEEGAVKALHSPKQSKDENHIEVDLNFVSDAVAMSAIETLVGRCPDLADAPIVAHSNGVVSPIPKLDNAEVTLEGGDEKLHGMEPLPRHLRNSINSERLRVGESDATLPRAELKYQDADKDSGSSCQTCDKIAEVKVEPLGSSIVQGDPLQLRHSSNHVDEPMILGDSDPLSTHKSVAGNEKPSPASSASAPCRSSGSGGKTNHSTKQQRVKAVSCTAGDIDNATAVEYVEESTHEVSREPVEDHSKGSEWSGSKTSHTSRASIVYASKGTISDSRKQLVSSSSRGGSTTENTSILSGSAEATGSSQAQKESVQTKLMPSGVCQKNEKINHPHSSSRVHNHPTAMHPPPSLNATTALSDEELALLLHQELNSSPRVPRVPRIRQAASMQLGTPAVASMLKRSSSGGKDHSFSRRKSKEDGHRNPCETIGESVSSTDAVPVKKNSSLVDGGNGRCPSPPSEPSEEKGPAIDDGALTCRTLPGLIDEILSKGRCTTYEEICDAVCPHWHNLRKPNGERYAYSSHSHAVLDCLRNRSEWAHLIDRGPKTNSSKRRRKPETDTVESEDEEVQPKKCLTKGKRSRHKRRLEVVHGKEAARKGHDQGSKSDNDFAASSRSSSDDDDDRRRGPPRPADEALSSSS